jgi:hypothetical protein
MDTGLIPLEGYALVEVTGGQYKNIVATTKAYEGKSTGICIRVSDNPGVGGDLVGKRVFWEAMREGAPIKRNDGEYVFIKLEDIQGYELS